MVADGACHLVEQSAAPELQTKPTGIFGFVVLMNLAASIHFVWFYLSYVPCYLHLADFEQGLEKTPFQHRLLMVFPLRWAHQSATIHRLAAWLSGMSAWFPRGVRAEGLIEAPIDLVCVIITGLVARAMYRKASPTGILAPYVYPLTLLMIVCTYSLYTMHRFRFVYDLPSLALFAAGLYILYFERSRYLFAVLFFVATINRETSLLLLVFYALMPPVVQRPAALAQRSPRWLHTRWTVMTLLSLYWLGWHLWVSRHFAHNPSESWSRIWLNVGILLWPTSWIQILSTFAFCWPLILVARRTIADRTLRAWQWVLPLWLLLMLRYGIFVETRIFGELIPYMACMAALIAERRIVHLHSKLLGRFPIGQALPCEVAA